MKPNTKAVSKRGGGATGKEIADLKAALDDLIHRVPTFSQIELNQAKEKLIQKIASTTNRAASPLITDVRKKINPNKIDQIIQIAFAAAALTIISRAARDVAADFSRDQNVVCSDFKKKRKCEKNYPPCAWCPKRTCPDGHKEVGCCYSTEPSPEEAKKQCDECTLPN